MLGYQRSQLDRGGRERLVELGSNGLRGGQPQHVDVLVESLVSDQSCWRAVVIAQKACTEWPGSGHLSVCITSYDLGLNPSHPAIID